MRTPTEAAEQVTIMQWAKYNTRRYPELALLHHIPNGGHRHKATAGRMKAEGVRSGVPDLCLPAPRPPHHGLYLELKRRKGGNLTDNQRWWVDQLTEQGYKVIIAKGANEAITALEHYLKGASS